MNIICRKESVLQKSIKNTKGPGEMPEPLAIVVMPGNQHQ